MTSRTFLSTLSLRRATQSSAKSTPEEAYFYPRSPCGERRLFFIGLHLINSISIHALLAESDGGSGVGSWPREIFLSTLSLRRATVSAPNRPEEQKHFYPRSPCGERPPNTFRHCTTYLFLSTLSLRRATTIRIHTCQYFFISIHALLAESD